MRTHTGGFVAIAALALTMSACTVTRGGEDPSVTSATTTLDPPLPIVLEADGLGAVAVGDDAEATIADLTSRFGEPSLDSGWGPGDSAVYGTCPGDQLRAVGWGSFLALFLRREDGSPEELFTWTYGYIHEEGTAGIDPRNLDLRTVEGLGLGTTRREARSLYGDRLVELADEELDLWFFTIDGDRAQHLRGSFTDETDDGEVLVIERVPTCANLTDLTTGS